MSPPAKSSFLLPALVILAAIAATAEPECPTKCGDVDIPYPFGIGGVCSHGKDFEISCINNGTTAVLQSDFHTMQVLSLSLEPPLAKVMLPVAYKCYNPENGYPVRESDGHVDLWSHGIFRISDDRNMFVVLGCNTGAFTMNSGAGRRGQYYAGCFTTAACPGAPRTAGAPASAAATSTSRPASPTTPSTSRAGRTTAWSTAPATSPSSSARTATSSGRPTCA